MSLPLATVIVLTEARRHGEKNVSVRSSPGPGSTTTLSVCYLSVSLWLREKSIRRTGSVNLTYDNFA